MILGGSTAASEPRITVRKGVLMKKAVYAILISVLAIVAVLVVCSLFSAHPYPYKKSKAEIISVEIVEAKSALDFTTVKTLSEEEMAEFFEVFDNTKFIKYMGTPTEVEGTSFRLIYAEGEYEIFSANSGDYVNNGVRYICRNVCKGDGFEKLLSLFDTDGSTT